MPAHRLPTINQDLTERGADAMTLDREYREEALSRAEVDHRPGPLLLEFGNGW